MEKKKIAICLACVAASLAMCVSVGAEETGGVSANAANSTPPGRLVVSTLWFENRADSQAEHWRYALKGFLWNQLGQVKAIRSRGGIGYARRKLSIVEGSALNADQARRIGEIVKTQRVIWGSYQRHDDKWQVSVYLLNVATGEMSDPLTAASTDWYEIRDKLTEQILGQLEIRPSKEEQKKLILRATTSPQALEWYAKAYQAVIEERLLSEPEECFRKAIAADPQFAEAYRGLASVFGTQGEFAQAEEMIRRALEIRPDDALSHGVLGKVLLLQTQFAEAEIELLEALRLEPDNTMALSGLGEIYSVQGRWDKAIVYEEKAIILEPMDASIHAQLGLAYTHKRDRNKAMTALKEAERLIEGSIEATNTEQILFQAYRHLGEISLAVEHGEKFVAQARKVGANPEMVSVYEEEVQQMKVTLTPTFIEAAMPKTYTAQTLQEELTKRLTVEELEIVSNPIAGNADMKRWAEQLTEGSNGDLDRAKALFDGLTRRMRGESGYGIRTAREVFDAWSEPDEVFVCQDYAKLYVALARDINIPAFYVHVDKVYDDQVAYHDCAAVFAEGKVLLVDPLNHWFGAPYEEFDILDDLQAIAHHLFQGADLSRSRLAVKLHPDYAWGQLGLARALISAKQYAESLKAVETAAKLEPGRWDIFLLRGLLAITDGNFDLAEDYLRQALELNPRDSGSHYHLGSVLAMQAKLKEACDEFRASVRYNFSVRYDFRNEIAEKAQLSIVEINEMIKSESAQEYATAVLVYVSQGGHIETVKRMLAEGADVNGRDTKGYTALITAALNGHADIVELLLKSNADVNAQRKTDGTTALMVAAQEGYSDIVKLLLESNADVNVHAATNGSTALMMAALNGHTDIVKLLLQSKADVNARNNYGTTALMAASATGHKEIALLLIDKGADITVVNAMGFTALEMARRSGHAEIVELLVKALQSQFSAWRSEGMPISPSELLEHYDGRFIKSAKVHIRLIDIRPSDLKPAQIKASEGETGKEAALGIAKQLCERVREGEDFGELAKACSHGHRKSFGGLWSPITPGSLRSPYDVLEEHARNMQPGQVSEPIQNKGHVFVLKLEQRVQKTVQLFDEVKDILEEELRAIKRKKFEEQIRRQ